jgi:predicted GNAT family N-acyltransferase
LNAPVAGDYAIEPLADGHDRSAFDCGVETLNRYLREQAGQDARRRIASPFLMVHRDTRTVAGFYTLANTALAHSALPADLARKLPRYPYLPATFLGRLAVDVRQQTRRLGEYLLLDALCRSLRNSLETASFAVVVDASNEHAKAFYLRYDFVALPEEPLRLLLLMRTIAQMDATN